MTKITLYGSIICPYVQRVRFALEALKVEYDYIEVDLYKDEQSTEEYVKINPQSEVPTVLVDGKPVYESLLILEYLENQYGNLFPADNVAKAYQRFWVQYFDKNIASKFFGIFSKVESKDREGAEKVVQEVLDNIKFFTQKSGLAENFKKDPNTYFAGNQLTYVDFAIVPHLRIFESHSINLLGKNFFDYGIEDEQVNLFRAYVQHVKNSAPYQAIADKLSPLPVEKNSLLRELGLQSNDAINFESLQKEYVTRKWGVSPL